MAWIEPSYGITSREEFHRRVPDEETARRRLKALVWQKGRFRPCRYTKTRGVRAPRPGLYECGSCTIRFTNAVGRDMRRTKVRGIKEVERSALPAASGASGHIA